MSSFSWILLFLASPLRRSDAQVLSALVRDADDVVLPCPHVLQDPSSCRDAVWTQNDSLDPVTISERRNVTASCSLLIRDVNLQDGGVYGCTTPRRNQSRIVLSVVSIVECKSHRFVTLECSTSGGLPHRVQWQGFEREVGVVTEQSSSFASVSFSTAHPVHAARTYELWRCHVTDNITAREHVFIYSPKYPGKTTTTTGEAGSTLDQLMVALRVAELLLLVFISVLLFRSRGRKTPAERQVFDTSARFTSTANQVQINGDRQEVPVNYENV